MSLQVRFILRTHRNESKITVLTFCHVIAEGNPFYIMHIMRKVPDLDGTIMQQRKCEELWDMEKVRGL